MPFIFLCLMIFLVIAAFWLLKSSNRGSHMARWILGGGMIVTLMLASRVFGARVLYAFLPAIQAWMMREGGDKKENTHAKQEVSDTYTGMSRKEAALILGVSEAASEEEIRAAYKQLMLKLHPDQGGNDYLAGKLNRARETLLG